MAIPNEFFLFGSPIIGLFAIAPLYIAVSRAKNYREAFWICGLQGLTVHLLSSFWLGNFKDFALFTLGASAVGTAFIEACAGLFFFFPFSRYSSTDRLKESSGTNPFLLPLRIVWFAGLFTVWEWAKSTGFLAYPWGTLSMTAYKWSYITQIADITGPYGITFLFAFFSSIIGEGILLIPAIPHAANPDDILLSWKKIFYSGITLLLVSTLYGGYQYSKPRSKIKTLNAVLVQQDLDPWNGTEEKGIEISDRLTETKINEFKKEGLSPDLVVWSEAVLLHPFPTSMTRYSNTPPEEPLISFIKRMHVPFIIGGSLTINREQHEYSNATILLDKNGAFSGAYAKLHLVPFAEVIPGAQYPWVHKLLNKVIGFSTGWTPGNQYVLYEIPISTPVLTKKTSPVKIFSLTSKKSDSSPASVFVSTPICFDDAFSEVCRGLFLAGSEVFINLTDDSWSLTDSAEYQHFVVASYRAIEYRTTLVRSTNSGFSVVLDPAGRILHQMPVFEQHALAVSIPVYPRILTIYARLGNWLPLICLFLAVLFIACCAAYDLKSARNNIK